MVAIIIGILIVAILADMTTRRIPNALILAGLITGLLWSAYIKGSAGLAESIINIIISTVMFYILYVIKALGAGDVKLLIVLASFLGAKDTVRILFVSMLLCLVYGCIRLIISGMISKKLNLKKGVSGVLVFFNYFRFDLFINGIRESLLDRLKAKKLYKIPYSPFILMAILYWRYLM